MVFPRHGDEGKLVDPTHPGHCWASAFANPVLVEGYPIPRRSTDYPGLEIPLETIATLLNCQRATTADGYVILKRDSAALIPTKQSVGIVSWHYVFNEDGTLRASYKIRRSRLKLSKLGACFDKITVSMGPKFLTVGASALVGRKDKPIHRRSIDFIIRVRRISENFVVLYDVTDKQGWLVDGASALLHLVRASLEHSSGYSSDLIPLSDPLATLQGDSRKETSIEVLTDQENLSLIIHRNPDRTETKTITPVSGEQITGHINNRGRYSLKDMIEEFCDSLELMTENEADIATSNGHNLPELRASKTVRGYDFLEVAMFDKSIYRYESGLKACTGSWGWVDLIRALHAVTLFGRGFGNLFKSLHETSTDCLYAENPKGHDYLAVCVSEIESIVKKKGDTETTPWRLIDSLRWHSPEKAFEPCNHSVSRFEKHDRLQELLPYSPWGRTFHKAADVFRHPHGAVLFGHAFGFPQYRRNLSDPEQERRQQGMRESTSIVPSTPTGRQESGSDTRHRSVDSAVGLTTPITPTTPSRTHWSRRQF
ncbi:hypothetical protein F5Y15DRAFT_424022 [Xylariaceae sp. FL0016]|nr:hypothetical protein F5Y15DRAFT_424022 [Xylariaceae sp. FL0016]